MRVCDRCGNKSVAETLKRASDGAENDLCHACLEAYCSWISQQKTASGKTANDTVRTGSKTKKAA